MKKITASALLIYLGCCLPVLGAADEERNRLSGTVGIGMIVVDGSDNLDPQVSNKRLEGLDREADGETFVLPVLMPDLVYDIGGADGTKLYLNGKAPIEEAGGFAMSLGATHAFTQAGTTDFAIFLTPFDRVYKNPYLTETIRESTSSARFGAKAGLDGMFGTGLSLSAVYMSHDVDEDVIGQLEPDLARDGAVYALVVGYELVATPTWGLQPRLTVSKGDYDGESNSYARGRIELAGRWSRERLTLLPQVFYSHAVHDRIDPVFAETRRTDNYGAMLIASYAQPFGLENWALQGLAGYARGESNITFYDTEAMSAAVFMSYRL